MKKIKKAFSFVELIVVVAILAIITASSTMYFWNTIDKLNINNAISNIEFQIQALDNKVSSREIFDYEINFFKDKNYYVIYENIFDNNYKLKLDSFNESNKIWNFKIISWYNSNTWAIKFYKWYKFIKQDQKTWDQIFTWSFSEITNYKLTWSYSWTILNKIYFNYFNNNLILKQINTNNSSNLGSVKIQNILWKKIFNNDVSTNKIDLYFENNSWTWKLELKE